MGLGLSGYLKLGGQYEIFLLAYAYNPLVENPQTFKERRKTMKKFFVCLLVAVVLLGRMTLEDWNKITDVNAFLHGIAFVFSQSQQCNAEIKAMSNGEEVIITGRCLGKGEVSL